MRARWIGSLVAVTLMAGMTVSQRPARLNPLIDLLEQKRPVFGLYAPANPRNGRGPSTGATVQRSPLELARAALDYENTDFLFDGSMEGDFDRGFEGYAAFVGGMAEAGQLLATPVKRLRQPLIVKTPEIAPDPALAIDRISRQLNLGTSGIVFVNAESAEEVRAGLAAMRFRSQGGTRPDDVGTAPSYWGLTEEEYRERADLWPLNPRGELVNWTIVESKEGLANVREIAAVEGIGVLFPGAGTLRRVFSSTDANGNRVLDEEAWEAAIQQVLAACKEFNVPCGYPATAEDIGQRMKQGFSVFIMGWGEQGFDAIDTGRRLSGR